MAFKFGADPEFLIVNERKRLIPANSYLGNETLLPTRMDAIVGCNGHASTAEMRPRPVDTTRELDEQCQNLLKRCYDEYVSRANPRTLNSERLFLYFNPSGMDDTGHNEPCGGHIHVTSDDQLWWKSYQARITLPFWTSVIAFLCDKSQKVRARSGSYGRFMQMGRSPDSGAWGNTWVGWEYRTPGTWLAPKNTEFRNMLFKAIDVILAGRDASALEKQKAFCDAVFGYDVGARQNVGNAYMYSGRIMSVDPNIETQLTSRPVEFIRKLKEIAAAQDYHEMDWFLSTLDESASYPLDKNPEGLYPSRARAKPAKPMFANMAKALEAVVTVADEAIASGKFSRYYKTGFAECKRLRITWKREEVDDPLRGGRVEVVRDTFVPELSYHAVGLAKDTVLKKLKNERGEGRRFDNPPSDDIWVYGALPTHGDAETVVFTREEWFAENRVIRDYLAQSNLKIAPWNVGRGSIGMTWAFRESEDKTVFVILALYFLWRLNYIAEGRTGDDASAMSGLGALFG